MRGGHGLERASLFAVAICLCLATSAHAVRWYVSPDGSDGDGRSWASARRTLRSALMAAGEGDEIWVAKGVYVLGSAAGPDIARRISYRNGLSVYGGFAGYETSLEARDPSANATIISAAAPDSGGKLPAWQVMRIEGSSNILLDGLILTGAYCPERDYLEAMELGAESGGGLAVLDSGESGPVVLSRCVLVGNRSPGYGGGLYTDESIVRAENCVISGNEALRDGGGVYTDAGQVDVVNCVVSGNRAGRIGGGVGAFSMIPAPELEWTQRVLNCTVSGNSAARSGGGFASYGSEVLPQAINTMIVRNTPSGIRHRTDVAYTLVRHCLFRDNGAADYSDETLGDFTGANAINLAIPNTEACTESPPVFVMDEEDYPLHGRWTASPTWDDAHLQSRLVDANASLAPHTLAGRILLTSATQPVEMLVIDNLTTQVWVMGKADDSFAGAAWRIADYQLRDGSGGIDEGSVEDAPAADHLGTPRPGGDERVDIGAFESPDGWTPPPDTLAPGSFAGPLPAWSNESPFPVAFRAFDATSGVDYVLLYYRIPGRDWVQYPGQFTESPILFNAAQAWGDNYYEFHTIAVDGAGLREPPPPSPDGACEIVTAYHGVIYVDADSILGNQTGFSWESACLKVAPALARAAWYGNGEVWIKTGVYYEPLVPVSGQRIFGGFAGNETEKEQRNPAAHPTVFDGSQLPEEGGNVYSPVTIRYAGNVLIDGLTITGGDAPESGGGVTFNWGLEGNVLSNCVIRDNRAPQGGGIYSRATTPLITRCLITRNIATESGGGLYLLSPGRIENCIIVSNEVRFSDDSLPDVNGFFPVWGAPLETGGGGIMARTGAVEIVNCTIAHNRVETSLAGGQRRLVLGGGGAGFLYSASTLRNCIVAGNSPNGIQELGADARASLVACLFHGNDIADYAAAEVGLLTGATWANSAEGVSDCVDGDPLFVSASPETPVEQRDYRLRDGSPAIDSGSTEDAPAADFDAVQRPGDDGLIDIGAYESADDLTGAVDLSVPEAFVAASEIPPATADSGLGISFRANTACEGVALYWRKAPETQWNLFDQTAPDQSLLFTTAQAAGPGCYGFQAVGIAADETREAIGDEPEAECLFIGDFAGDVVHASPDGAGARTGASWADACAGVARALSVAETWAREEIWLRHGTYGESISLPSNVALRGGFQGDEQEAWQRLATGAPTILDGSRLNGPGRDAARVVLIRDCENVTLDRLVITGANGANEDTATGEVLAAGVVVMASTGRIVDCVIAGNKSCEDGGGLAVDQSTVDVERCVFAGNEAYFEPDASGGLGGGACATGRIVYGEDRFYVYSNVTFTNCLFAGNWADDGGGLAFYRYVNGRLVNCTFADNCARWTDATDDAVGYGGAVGLQESAGANIDLVNCLFARNAPSGLSLPIVSGPPIFRTGTSVTLTATLYYDNALGDLETLDLRVNDIVYFSVAEAEEFINNELSSGGRSADGQYGNPAFVPGSRGQWTAAPAFDYWRNRTALTDASAGWQPGALVGRLVKPSHRSVSIGSPPAEERRLALILGNTATTIEVVGNVTGFTAKGDTYELVGYDLTPQSLAIDVGDGVWAPEVDLLGRPRPVDVSGMGQAATGYEFDIGAYECQEGFGPTPTPTPVAEPTPTPTPAPLGARLERWMLYE